MGHIDERIVKVNRLRARVEQEIADYETAFAPLIQIKVDTEYELDQLRQRQAAKIAERNAYDAELSELLAAQAEDAG